MNEQRYSYATVGKTEEREVPAVLLGKRNATFSIAGDEYERTAILKLPEKMNQTEFDAWKDSAGVDLIDMFFHCIHQKSVRAEAPEDRQPELPDAGDDEVMTDGGSSMPKLALEHLKELKAADEKLGEWLSEVTGDEFERYSEIYPTEHAAPEANNDIELGEGGFSLKEAEFAELLGILEQSRVHAADSPLVLGVRNRLLMQLILANPAEYARVKAEEEQRQQQAAEEVKRERNQQRARERMTERASDLSDAVDIPIGDEEDGDAR